MIFVGYNCLWALGLETGPEVSTRVVVHGVLGCVLFGALVVKVVAVRSHAAPGWFLPVAGGLLFAVVDRRDLDVGDLVPRRPRLARRTPRTRTRFVRSDATDRPPLRVGRIDAVRDRQLQPEVEPQPSQT